MAAPDHSGRQVGGFELLEPLASGGFATVYRARQVRLDREVAVKVLDPALARIPEIAARFEREGRASASLDHPNVVAVYEAGEHDGLVYLAMRLVDGETLDDVLLREGTLRLSRTAKLLAPVADALDHAHGRGLIHRDVKPSNIFIDADRVWLGDFGIAATADQVGKYTTGALGTAHYMAPEQASGESVDGRVDVYALGCVAFRCLVGRPPHDRGDLVATLVAHVSDPVPTTGHAALDRFFSMALAKDPSERFARATDLVASLRSVGPVDLEALAAPVAAEIGSADPAIVPLAPSTPATEAGPPPSAIAPVRVAQADDSTVPHTPESASPPTEAVGIGVAPASAPATTAGVPTGSDAPAGGSRGSSLPSWSAVVVGALLVVALLGVGWLAFVRDGGDDGGAPEVFASVGEPIPVGSRPLVVAIDGDSVLVANVGDQSLSVVPIDGGPAVPAAALGAAPSDVHAAGGVAWVTTRTPDRTVLRLDLDTRRFTALPLGFEAARVAADDDGAWVSDPDGGRVVRLDGAGQVVDQVAVDGSPTDLVLADGSLWVADTGDDTVIQIDAGSGAVVSTTALAGGAGAITASDTALYVTDRAAATLTRIPFDDLDDQSTVGVADQPTRPEVGAGGVWLLSPAAGTLHRHDPDTLEELQVIEVTGTLGGMAIARSDVWVTRADGDELVKVTPGS